MYVMYVDSKTLGEQWKSGVPIEVLQHGYVAVINKITILGGKPKLRMGGAAKACTPHCPL
jgi:ribose 5-phosphate isomerase